MQIKPYKTEIIMCAIISTAVFSFCAIVLAEIDEKKMLSDRCVELINIDSSVDFVECYRYAKTFPDNTGADFLDHMKKSADEKRLDLPFNHQNRIYIIP